MGKRGVVLLLCVLLPMAQVNLSLSLLCECFHKVVCMHVCCVLCVVCAWDAWFVLSVVLTTSAAMRSLFVPILFVCLLVC